MKKYNYFESPFKGEYIHQQVSNPNITVGRYSYYSGYYHGHSFDDCVRYLIPDRDDVDKLIIGDFCSIGTGVSFIMAGNQGHRLDWASSFPFFYFNEEYSVAAKDGFKKAGDTIIGSDVWIGAESMIMPGVEIGHGAVIGARSVITKSIKPYTIVAGNPAKIIRDRFPEDKVKLLLEMRWWDWPENRLKGAMEYLCSDNIEELYQYWKTLIKG